MKDIIDLIGRLMLGFIFLFEAYDSIVFFKTTQVQMTSYNIHWNQELLLTGAIVFLIVGSLLVITGYRSSLGVTMLLIYWIPVTFIVHSWWNDPVELRRIESIHFMKNLAITGGLLMLYVNGSGRYSIKRLFATTRVS